MNQIFLSELVLEEIGSKDSGAAQRRLRIVENVPILETTESAVMGKHDKLYRYILLRHSDANVSFDGLCMLLKRLGFSERIRGDHHIFTMDGIDEILNLQPGNTKAKPYQVKQVREVILHYNLVLED
uniref:HicA toxin of toxin-antitoxin n=1 Tax=Candidatus Kentrum sp. MB TaxID=2138164 RepID=A0A450XYI0_9GAMM|nr:MAG: hypothetical protein BECKMB1821G_GA0114241_100819 [Candidatus Kentron sp. MB]VFK34315.1 MAG: hypothetical protein BECKMB1821I_GA0114274_106718 [Candidatus Kentron sp. MB]VFK76652.1 MAG: hypothetical protein BECKMB1821H_GA0114242_106618 [Candidatus Kentron sp. MB]